MSDAGGDPRAAARAIDALRRGWPIAIGETVLLAIETADAERLAAFDPSSRAEVLLSAGRAATLKLADRRDTAPPDTPVRIARTPGLDFEEALALADPARTLAMPFKREFRAIAEPDAPAAAAALKLARIAGLLPAFFVGGTGAEIWLTPADIAAHEDPARLAIATRAQLPIAGADAAEIVAFRSPDSADEHVALLIGVPNGQSPLVRLHSQCLTGDVLKSLKCDCGAQLDAAIRAIAASGWGMLLYLRQEGRGIGLVNKLRAYALQDQGFDTVDANLRLGFAVDARNFALAGRMLALLGQGSVRLLTNNPAKVAGLEAAGTRVIERVPHRAGENPHNARYLVTKRDRVGHQL